MVTRLRWFVVGVVLTFAGLLGYWYTRYVFDTTPPVIMVSGIEPEGFYAGEAVGMITGSDEYKVADLSLWLDDKPLLEKHRINRKTFSYSFPIATTALTPGKHVLKVSVYDASAQRNSTTKEVGFYVDNAPLHAAFVKSDGDYKVFQGKTLHVQFQVNKEIKKAEVEAFSHIFSCVPESQNSLIYECFIPIDCEEKPSEHVFKVLVTDKVGNTEFLENRVHVVMFPFKKQTLTTAQTDRVSSEEAGVSSEAQFERDVAEATQRSAREKLWQGPFYVPIEARGTSTEFGTLRTTQQRGKYRHNAIDLLGTPRSVVWAPQDGVIIVKNDYEHSGRTVGIDHGCGVLSFLFHLDSFAPIEVGQKIKKGKPVGTLGKTGFASGYHVHWEMRVNNVQVDPVQWTQQSF